MQLHRFGLDDHLVRNLADFETDVKCISLGNNNADVWNGDRAEAFLAGRNEVGAGEQERHAVGSACAGGHSADFARAIAGNFYLRAENGCAGSVGDNSGESAGSSGLGEKRRHEDYGCEKKRDDNTPQMFWKHTAEPRIVGM